MKKLYKFLQAYKFYCIEEFSIYDLQEAAQFDLENHNVESDNLFHFAYILDIKHDELRVFEKYLGYIVEEFGLPGEIDLSCKDVLAYVAHTLNKLKNGTGQTIFNGLCEIECWLNQSNWTNKCKHLFKEDANSQYYLGYDRFQAILNEIYKKPLLSAKLMDDFCNLDHDNFSSENEHNLAMKNLEIVIRDLLS